jgi:hypothetical protein
MAALWRLALDRPRARSPHWRRWKLRALAHFKLGGSALASKPTNASQVGALNSSVTIGFHKKWPAYLSTAAVEGFPPCRLMTFKKQSLTGQRANCPQATTLHGLVRVFEAS